MNKSGLNFELITEKLKERGWNQKMLAEKLGIWSNNITSIKYGRLSPGLVLILKISKLFNVHPLDICRVDYFTELLEGYPYVGGDKK